MSDRPQSAEEMFETVIDNIGLAKTLELIGDVCAAKAEHIRSNWQDAPLAKTWDKAGTSVKTCATVIRRFHGIT